MEQQDVAIGSLARVTETSRDTAVSIAHLIAEAAHSLETITEQIAQVTVSSAQAMEGVSKLQQDANGINETITQFEQVST